jgi:Ion transport protein
MNFVSDAFTVVFLVESWLKIIAMGFVFNKYSYLRQTWNAVDFLIVLTG